MPSLIAFGNAMTNNFVTTLQCQDHVYVHESSRREEKLKKISTPTHAHPPPKKKSIEMAKIRIKSIPIQKMPI